VIQEHLLTKVVSSEVHEELHLAGLDDLDDLVRGCRGKVVPAVFDGEGDLEGHRTHVLGSKGVGVDLGAANKIKLTPWGSARSSSQAD
jgi:hypothetical protein